MSTPELNAGRHFVTSGDGKRVAVIVDMAMWEKLVEQLEELDDLRAYDEAMAGDLDGLPLDEALAEIERARAGSPV